MSAHRRLVDGDNHILLWADNGKLPHGAVGPVHALGLAHPDLEPIAQEVVKGFGVVDGLSGGLVLKGGGQLYIVLGQNPLALPHAAVGVQLHQAQVVLQGGQQTAAAGLHAVGHAVPAQVVGIDADFQKQVLRQKLLEALAGLFPHNGAQHGRAGGVVHKGGAGLVIDGDVQEIPNPVLGVPGHFIHAAAHAKHVPHRQLLQVFAGILRGFLRENVNQPLVQLQNALGISNTHSGGGVGFGVGLEAVAQVGAIRRPPALGADLAVAHNHQAVHFGGAVLQVLNVAENVLAVQSHRFRRDPFKFFSHWDSAPFHFRVRVFIISQAGKKWFSLKCP